MLKRSRLGFALALASTLAIGSVGMGCSDGAENTTKTTTSSSSSSSSSGGSSSSSSSSSSGTPVCENPDGLVFAVNELYFGEGNSGEWKSFGYDLDGKSSTQNSKDLCKLNAGATSDVPYPDGDNGIDNSFGKNLLPTVLGLVPTWVKDINLNIDNGKFTALIKMMCVPTTGDVPQFTTKLLAGTSLNMPPDNMLPKFDGTDKWPIEPGLLSDPLDPESSTILFQSSSITGNTYDGGKGVVFIISVPLRTPNASTSIKLTLYHARIKMELNADRTAATKGMIGGVLDTEEFIAEIKKVGALVNLCPALDGLITQVRQASDILVDGTQDPTKTCNGITMGLGFDMVAAVIGDVGPTNPVGSSCP